MEETHYIGAKVSRRTYDAILKMQAESPIRVSINAIVQHLLDEALGLEKPASNGKRARK